VGPSIAEQILLEVVRRIAALPSWEARLRTGDEAMNRERLALIHHDREKRRPLTNRHILATLPVLIEMRAQREWAMATYDNNPFSMVRDFERQLAQALHAEPSQLGIGAVVAADVDGLGPPETEQNVIRSELRLSVVYRHDYRDPSVYTETGED
jgi:hypothetical protein